MSSASHRFASPICGCSRTSRACAHSCKARGESSATYTSCAVPPRSRRRNSVRPSGPPTSPASLSRRGIDSSQSSTVR
jgi:hypothetical protein